MYVQIIYVCTHALAYAHFLSLFNKIFLFHICIVNSVILQFKNIFRATIPTMQIEISN